MTTDSMVPMATLAGEWGINANTVSRRLKFLGIKPERQGNNRFITLEQKALADELQSHILSGKSMDTFPVRQADGSTTTIQKRQPTQVAGLALNNSELVAALLQMQQQMASTKPSRAEELAKAADGGWTLTTDELKERGVKGIEGFKDGDEAYGYRFNRHKQRNTVLWTLTRSLISRPVASSEPASLRALPEGSSGIGFLREDEAVAQVVNITAMDCTGSSLFSQNTIS